LFAEQDIVDVHQEITGQKLSRHNVRTKQEPGWRGGGEGRLEYVSYVFVFGENSYRLEIILYRERKKLLIKVKRVYEI
jgi:hypothetical protein